MPSALSLQILTNQPKSTEGSSLTVETRQPIDFPLPESRLDRKLDIGILDRLRNLERRLSKSVLPGLLEVFEGHVPANCVEMRQSLAKGDAATLRKISHKLKSSAHCLGLTRLSTLCAELERRASRNILVEAESLLSAIEEEFDRGSMALRDYLMD